MKLKHNVHIDLQRCAVAADGNETSTAENMSIRTWYRDDTDYGIGFRKLLNCTSTARILLGNCSPLRVETCLRHPSRPRSLIGGL